MEKPNSKLFLGFPPPKWQRCKSFVNHRESSVNHPGSSNVKFFSIVTFFVVQYQQQQGGQHSSRVLLHLLSLLHRLPEEERSEHVRVWLCSPSLAWSFPHTRWPTTTTTTTTTTRESGSDFNYNCLTSTTPSLTCWSLPEFQTRCHHYHHRCCCCSCRTTTTDGTVRGDEVGVGRVGVACCLACFFLVASPGIDSR